MRIRTIKPEFFRHERLALLSTKARLLFVGLWCIADAEGRLEDRPQRIRIEIFPYETDGIETELEQLCSAGFIARYSAQGAEFIEVTAFKKHQRITGKEAKYVSKIPPRDVPGIGGETPEKQQAIPRCVTGAQERKKEEGEKKPKNPRFAPGEFDHLLSRSMRESPEFLQTWHTWLESRHSRKKRVSEYAAKAQIKTMHTAGVPAGIAMMQKSIAGDYQGIFPDKLAAPPARPAGDAPTFADLLASGQIRQRKEGPRLSLDEQIAADLAAGNG